MTRHSALSGHNCKARFAQNAAQGRSQLLTEYARNNSCSTCLPTPSASAPSQTLTFSTCAQTPCVPFAERVPLVKMLLQRLPECLAACATMLQTQPGKAQLLEQQVPLVQAKNDS